MTAPTQSRRRAALSTLFGTGATVAITVGQTFILIPLCLTHLGTHLYGAWLGASELLIWLQFLDMGIPNLMTQRIGAALGKKDDVGAAHWSVTGLALLAVIGAALSVLAIVTAPLVTAWVRVPQAETENFTASFRIGAVAGAMLLGFNGLVGVSRGVQSTGLLNGVQVAGAMASLVGAAVLLVAGFGIRALAFALLARALICFGGGVWFLVRLRKQGTVVLARPSLQVTREILTLAPPMAGSTAAYVLANNSEILLVTAIFGPVAATAYTLTRRAVDGVRTLLDSIAWAVYGGFAHLVTAHDRHRARAVLHEILWLRLAVACLCGAVVIAVNRAFVTLLFGAENFAGLLLTIGFAMQMILSGQSFLASFLLRAAGRVREGSFLLAGESVARLLALTAAIVVLGFAAAPWAAAAASAYGLVVTVRRLDQSLPASRTAPAPLPLGRLVAPVVVVAGGVTLAVAGIPLSWISVALTAALVAIAGGGLLWLVVPAGRDEASLLRWSRR